MRIERPPGPRDLFFGARFLGPITRDMLGFYRDLQHEYGDVVYLRIGPYHDYTLFHPAMIRELLVEKAKSFIRMEHLMRVLRQWNGESVLIAEHDRWLRYRRLLQPAFQQQRFARYADEVTLAAADAVDALGRQRGPVDVERVMTDLTTAVICRTMFGTDLGDERASIREAVQTLSEVAIREMASPVIPPAWLPLPSVTRKRRAIQTIHAMSQRFIQERRAAGVDRGDLLSMLLLAVDEEGDGTGLTDEQARNQCVTNFFAGHDTTAAGLTFVSWALAAHPEIAERAAAEVVEVIGDRRPTFADLPRLSFVERIVKETLRHYPPAIGVFARQAMEDVKIGEWLIPRGSIVRVISYTTQHDPRWFPEPDRFDPDRFAPGREEQIPGGAYIPFGLGGRVCIGRFFAMMEMTLISAMLLQRFNLEPAAGQAEPRLQVGMSLRPADGMRLLFGARRAA